MPHLMPSLMPRRRHCKRLIAAVVLALSVPLVCALIPVTLSGCVPLGVASYKFIGPAPVPPKYVLPKSPTVVLVEKYQTQSTSNPQSDLLARQVITELTSHDVGPFVPIDKIQELRDARPAEFPKMSVETIAKSLNAGQVMYIELHDSDLSALAGGAEYSGSASATVKVIDGASGATLWPTDLANGYPVATSTKLGSKDTAMDVKRKLYAQMTDQIAKLFYKWRPEDETPADLTQ
jgi:hypothetical protein